MARGETLLSPSRQFHLWSYGVGRPELLLRSGFPHDDVVELLFEGVKAVNLDRLRFPDLEVCRGEDVTYEARRFLTIELRTPDHVGSVVCDSLTFFHEVRSVGRKQWSVRPNGLSA